MFNKLDEYIREFENEDFAMDYWYDEGVFIAQELIQDFEKEDWIVLLSNLTDKSIGWKRRLAYCLHDESDLNQLDILLKLIDTDDSELFELAVDSLRGFTGKESKKIIQNNPQILLKIKKLMPNVGTTTKKIFEEFLKGL